MNTEVSKMLNSIQEIDAPQLADWMDNESEQFHVIDVREMREISQGTVPGAKPLPLATLPARLHELNQTDKIIVICRSGVRSAHACMFMQEQGFDNVFNLRGGMIGWAHGNLPVAQVSVA
jgi:rhodanese-related sulfurtransferase